MRYRKRAGLTDLVIGGIIFAAVLALFTVKPLDQRGGGYEAGGRSTYKNGAEMMVRGDETSTTVILAAVTLVLVLAGCSSFIGDYRHFPVRRYVAARGGSDTNSGKRAGEPLATVNAALSNIAGVTSEVLGKVPFSGDTAEIIILGKLEGPVMIEGRNIGYPPIVLRGVSSAVPGTLNGTLTVGEGADVTLGEYLMVTGDGRGVEVIGGRFTLDGGIVADNTADGAGAGVYVGSGTFVMREGIIRDNRAVKKAGGGVYVSRDGVFRKTGGVISGNTVPPLYKGSQVFVFTGRGSKERDSPAGEGVCLDSASDEMWNE
jgi:hypothetical protein